VNSAAQEIVHACVKNVMITEIDHPARPITFRDLPRRGCSRLFLQSLQLWCESSRPAASGWLVCDFRYQNCVQQRQSFNASW